jgi:hypothetical protein
MSRQGGTSFFAKSVFVFSGGLCLCFVLCGARQPFTPVVVDARVRGKRGFATQLESTRFQPLSLQCDVLVSNFAFKCKCTLRRRTRS